MSEKERVDEVKKIIEQVSPTFCMAKWHHTSIYLHTGQTHSCYHPTPHDISKEEIQDNPSALHNTLTKKKERAKMLAGTRPAGCQYCWNVEDLGEDQVSDRHIRNSTIYQPERLEEILDNNWDHDINPEYIEIAFSNECNFKCGYCHPAASSSYHNEIKKYGPVKNVQNHSLDVDWLKPMQEDENPYVKAWWDWWPEVSKTLNIFRITGGEPMLHKSTWKMFEELKQNPRPHLELNVNSNLGIKEKMVEKFSYEVKNLIETDKVKKFKLYSSIDSYYERAEYLRTGLDVDLWERNMKKYLDITGAEITFMCTFNILSVTSFTLFLEKILEWRKLYYHPRKRRVRFDTPYLKEPLQYDMHILPKEEFLPYFDKILTFIQDHKDENDTTKFSELEYAKFKRVRDYFANVTYDEDKIEMGRKDFYNWFKEYDRRRKTDFLSTFPEMEDFWNLCRTYTE